MEKKMLPRDFPLGTTIIAISGDGYAGVGHYIYKVGTVAQVTLYGGINVDGIYYSGTGCGWRPVGGMNLEEVL